MEIGAAHYYILGEVITCSLSILLIINILLTFSPYDKRQRLFLYSAVSTFLAAFFDIIAVFCTSYYTRLSLSFCTFISTVFFIFLMFTPFVITNYVTDIAYAHSKIKKIGFSISSLVYTFYLIVIFINLKTGIVFKYTAEEGYVRGPWKNITYILTAFYSCFIVFSMIKNRHLLAHRIFWVFTAYPFISLGFVVFQFFNPHIIMTGIASFASVSFAYMIVHSYLMEVDSLTGLRTEPKLRKRIAMQSKGGVLYVFSIDNINLIQSSLDVADLDRFFLGLGGVFNTQFPRNAYHISTNRFAAIGRSVKEVSEKSEIIRKYIEDLTSDLNSYIPIPVESYSAAIEFSGEENDYDSLIDLVNSILVKAKSSQLRKMQLCDESVLVERERKRYIYRILKRELELESEQFQVWFQPIYSIEKKHFTYMEALSRLQNTELGNISPSEFV